MERHWGLESVSKRNLIMNPKVIVLILSYNGKYLLEDSISSYLANDYGNFDVVVIDNGSTDGTKDWVAQYFPEVFVLRTNKNLKYSGGLNFGMNYAFGELNADYVLITNNDVKVDSRVISSLVEVALTDTFIGFVIGKVYYYDQPDIFQSVGKGIDPIWWNTGHIGNMEKDQGQYNTIMERAFCDDIYWLVNKEVYNKTGGYDTEFAFQGEDFDWQVRAKQAGYKIMYTPKSKLWHKESMTIGKNSPFKAYYDARNPLIIHMKYRTAKQFKNIFHARLKSNAKVSIKMFIDLRWHYVFNIWQGMGSAILWGIRNRRLTWKHLL
jgi:GT2 family glycosyltransferase